MSLTIVWFIFFTLFLVIEIITVNLVTIWFAIGALVSLFVSFFLDSLTAQIVVFIIVSVVSVIAVKPLLKKFKGFNITPTNSDRVIGKIGEVTKKIERSNYGEVKVFGNTWTAYCDDEIDVGEKVKVLSIEGVKLIVEKEEK